MQGDGVRPGWLLDEVASAGRENLDAAHVARYDRKEDASAAHEVDLLGGLGLDTRSVVVDIGAGTGQFVMAVAPQCARVVAVDVSEPMLSHLDSNVAAKRLTNVKLVRAGFLTYRHEGPAADFVYSRYALHHLPDFWKGVALDRIHSILRKRGILRLWDVVYSFDPSEAEQRLEAWCATGGVDLGAEWMRAELEEHVRDEHSTYSWLLEAMLERAGFVVEDATYSDDAVSARYVARAV